MIRSAAGLATLVFVAAGSGCTWTHRCAVPTPVVEAAPGPRLPLTVEVRHAASTTPGEAMEVSGLGGPYGKHAAVVDAGAPTRALFDRLAASMFERTASPPAADLVLEIRLDRFRAATARFGPYTAEVGYHVAFRAPDGAEVAAFDAAGAATVAGSLGDPAFCGARGKAVALAMQEAGAAAVREVAGSDALAAWLAGRGVVRPAFTVRAAGSYTTPTPTSTSTPTATATPPPIAGAVPVAAEPPPRPVLPRSMSVRGGVLALRPETTAGKLVEPSRGVGALVLGFGARLLPWLSLDLPLEYLTRSYSASAVPHLTGFGPRTSLTSTSLGLGVRVSPPLGDRPVLVPWVGAGARVLYTKLTVSYFGGLSGGTPADTAWGAGADVGAGLDLHPGGPWVLGLEVRRLFARGSLAPLGAVGLGGVLLGGSVGAAFPP